MLTVGNGPSVSRPSGEEAENLSERPWAVVTRFPGFKPSYATLELLDVRQVVPSFYASVSPSVSTSGCYCED